MLALVALAISRRVVALVVLVLSVGVLIWLLVGDSDETKIMARLEGLARAVSTHQDESIVFRTVRLKSAFKEALEPSASLRAPELRDTNGVRELVTLAASVPQFYGQFDVSLGETNISIDHAAHDARAVSAVTLTSSFGGELRRDTRRVRFLLHETDGVWQVGFVEVEQKTQEQPEARP